MILPQGGRSNVFCRPRRPDTAHFRVRRSSRRTLAVRTQASQDGNGSPWVGRVDLRHGPCRVTLAIRARFRGCPGPPICVLIPGRLAVGCGPDSLVKSASDSQPGGVANPAQSEVTLWVPGGGCGLTCQPKVPCRGSEKTGAAGAAG